MSNEKKYEEDKGVVVGRGVEGRGLCVSIEMMKKLCTSCSRWRSNEKKFEEDKSVVVVRGVEGRGLCVLHGKDEEVMYLMFKMKEYRKI